MIEKSSIHQLEDGESDEEWKYTRSESKRIDAKARQCRQGGRGSKKYQQPMWKMTRARRVFDQSPCKEHQNWRDRGRYCNQHSIRKKEESNEENMRREGRPITINSYAIAKACKTSSKQMSETSTRKSTKRTRHLPGRCPRQHMAKYLIVKGCEQLIDEEE